MKLINTKHTTSLKLILPISSHFVLQLYGVADKIVSLQFVPNS
jgi:hypothetical protein